MVAPPFISDLSISSPIQAGQEVILSLSGQWPTPGWEHVNTSVDIDEVNRVLRIRYLGKSKGGLMMQVIKPFEDTIPVTFPSVGTWTLILEGKGEDFKQTVDVDPQNVP